MRSEIVTGSWLGGDGEIRDEVTVAFENAGYTVEGRLHGPDVSYVVRYDAEWSIRQFLLFRDMEEPDLWLGIDKFGGWGEMNGAVRPDLAGCTDIMLTSIATKEASGFLRSPALRRLIATGRMSGTARRAYVNVDTLEVTVTVVEIDRLPSGAWLDDQVELELDANGLVGNVSGSFTRIS